MVRSVHDHAAAISELLERPPAEQRERGYFHTLKEICQQPETWTGAAALVVRRRETLRAVVEGAASLLLTGSGSSLYAAECLDPVLEAELGVPACSIASGALLTEGARLPPSCRPALMVSIARSGNSPESCAAVDVVLEAEPEARHLILTTNAEGRLATQYAGRANVTAVVLDDATCDRSLVMTSSFTSMVMAGRFLGMLGAPEKYEALAGELARIARGVLARHAGALAGAARSDYRYAVFLGGGCRLGAAREAGLKTMEMTAGRVRTIAETCLGLRHGPMSTVHGDTLVVCFLSSEPVRRAYECDLIGELIRKRLGARKVIVGEAIPAELLLEGDVAVECEGLARVGDANAAVIDVLVGQLLGFFKCLAVGLRPDSPSEQGVINRVVENFQIYPRMRNERI